jgi:hypothetical protein
MEWLKDNYERAALIIVAIILLACSGLVVTKSLAFPELFTGRNSPKPADNTIKPYPTEPVTGATTIVKTPASWKGYDGSLFISRPYVLKDGKLFDPLEGTEDLHPPIKNSWLIKYDLPYWEGDIKDQDPDGDRFSNLEEFVAGTDPRDKASIPPYYTKLRLQKFISKPFRLIFTGTPDDGQTFTINTKDLKSRTQFLERDQMIRDTPYKVIGYEKKTITENEIEKDVSELTIENTETGQKMVLIANKEANDPTSFGEFLNLYDNSVFTVKKDDEFSMNPETDHKYKLIDITEKEAVIKDLKLGSDHKIPPVQ